MNSSRVVLVIITIFVSLTACRKNASENTLPPPPVKLERINSGYFWKGSNQRYIPVYWQREKIYELPARGYCTSMALENDQLALGGFYHSGQQTDLWFKINETEFELEVPPGSTVTQTRTFWIIK